MNARTDDGFTRAVRRGVLPLLVWAVHFFFGYVAIAVTCRAAWPAENITLLLGGASAVALAALAVLLWQAWRACRASGESLSGIVPVGAALLALIGVGWSSVPLLWLSPC